MTRLETTASRSRPFTTMAGRVLWAGVVALATACGGGGESTPAANAVNPPAPTTVPTPPPASAYSVVVRTVDTQGQSIAGARVYLLGSTALTGSDGATTFEFNSRQSGDGVLYAHQTGYHSAKREFVFADTVSRVEQQLTLLRTDEAQLVVTGVTSQVSADASSVVVNVDISVSGFSGKPIAGLSAADFSVPELDCQGFAFPCILESSGPLSTGYWTPSKSDPVQITLPGAGPSTPYRVRYVMEAEPGMFAAGRTALSVVVVRVGADTSLRIPVEVRL